MSDELLHWLYDLMKWGPDEEFFPSPLCSGEAMDEAKPAGRLRSNFLCNLGSGDPTGLHPRGPRLEFEEACWLF